MKNINKKSINFGLKILSILAFSLLVIPASASAVGYGTNFVYSTGYNSPMPQTNNPTPIVSSINPGSGNKGVGTKTITITGSGFIPGSVARINGSGRATTFIDSSHLLVQTNGTDMSRTDGFFISVFNGAPGGGYSNAVFFTLKTVAASASNTNNSNNSSPDTFSETTQTTGNTTSNSTDKNYSNLAANAIFGSDSFLPSGLIQWIIFAIIILLIVILARKIFGGEKNYHEAPMKHA